DAESMAGEFLAGVRSSLEKLLGELGIEAIRPATGSPLTPEHQPPDGAWSPEWSRGIVDQCLRRGYRRGDEILVPAVVLARTAGAPPVLSASGANGAGSQRDGYHSGLAGEAPPWLRTLEETARNLSDEEAGQVDPILRMFQELSREVAAANDAEGPSDEVLRPLLAELSLYLGAPRKRPKLPQPWSGALDTARGQCLTWLDQATQVIQVAPKPDEPVEPDSMEVVGEVPCVSAELAGCISEVVAIGFQRRGRAPAIYPAKVRRYRDTRSGS
ncbi:MAG: GrpE, partial [Armatimonadetes bacterium]|nr:GrpE [Armatimonadota bacterium]